MEIVRTEFRNPNGSIRDADLKVKEGLNDVENYQMPLDRLRSSGWFTPGVVEGLRVTAVSGQTTAHVGPGSASDRNGNLVVLSPGGAAIVDPSVDPLSPFNVPTVVVGDDGVEIDTTDARGECWLTLTWREVVGSTNPPVRRHAPWVRLLPAAQAAGNADLVALAALTLDQSGQVTSLAAGPRSVAGVRSGRLGLRAPQSGSGVLDEHPIAELSASADGLGLHLVADDGTPRPGLRLDRASGDLVIEQRLRLLDRPGGSGGLAVSATDSNWRFTDPSTNSDRLVLARTGNAGIGPGATAMVNAALHVAGLGVHTDGGAGGFSFADRGVAGFVSHPSQGERWVWYGFQGAARLWSGGDKLTVDAAGNVGINLPAGLPAKRSLHVSGGIGGVHTEGSNGGFSFADRNRDPALGYVDSPSQGERWVWYSQAGLARLWSGTDLLVVGDGSLGRQGGPMVLWLWGSRIGDVGGGILSIHSGGGTVDFSQGSTVRFLGPVQMLSSVFKPGSEFRIDHPLDPTGAYLNHSVVESPERLNAYVGTVVTDERGAATIELPTYFAALNRDTHVLLTPIGTPARVAVCAPVEGNQVSIVADVPGVAIDWLVTAVRQDRWAERHPMVVEEPKTGSARGRYLHPEEHGQPADRGIHHRPDPTKGGTR